MPAGFAERLSRWRSESLPPPDVAAGGGEANDLFADVRDRSAGRPVVWPD